MIAPLRTKERPRAVVARTLSSGLQTIVVPDVVVVTDRGAYAGSMVVDLAIGAPLMLSAATTADPGTAACVTVTVFCPTVAMGAISRYILSAAQWCAFYPTWLDTWASFTDANTYDHPFGTGDALLLTPAGSLRSVRVRPGAHKALVSAASAASAVARRAAFMRPRALREVGAHLAAVHHLVYGFVGAFADVALVKSTSLTTPGLRLKVRTPCGVNMSTVNVLPAAAATLMENIASWRRQAPRVSCCAQHAVADAGSPRMGAVVPVADGFAVQLQEGAVVTYRPGCQFLLMADVPAGAKAGTPCVKVSFGSTACAPSNNMVCGAIPSGTLHWAAVADRVHCAFDHAHGARITPGVPLLVAEFGTPRSVATGTCTLTYRAKAPRPVVPPATTDQIFVWPNVKLVGMPRTLNDDGTVRTFVVASTVVDHATGAMEQRAYIPASSRVVVRGVDGVPDGTTTTLASLVADCTGALEWLAARSAATAHAFAAPEPPLKALCAAAASPAAAWPAAGIPLQSPAPGPPDTPFTRSLATITAPVGDAEAIAALDAKLFPFGDVIRTEAPAACV